MSTGFTRVNQWSGDEAGHADPDNGGNA